MRYGASIRSIFRDAMKVLSLLLAGAAAKKQTTDSSVVYYSNDDGLITSSPASNGDIVSTVFPGDGKISYLAFSGSDMYFTDRVYNTMSKMDVTGSGTQGAAKTIHSGFSEPHDFVIDESTAGTHVRGKQLQ